MKKILIGSVIGLLGSWGVIVLDIKFVKWIFTMIPVCEWAGFVKIVIIFIDIWFTLGLCILPFALGIGIGGILAIKD
jgi:hypothetical protein